MVKTLNRFKTYIKKPENIILITLIIVLTYLVIVPLISIIHDTFVVHTSERMRIRGKQVGEFTLYHWRNIFFGKYSDHIFYKPLYNTLMVSIGVSIIALALGGLIAWLVTRTDLKYKRWISTLIIFPYVMPSWTLAMAWLDFFKNSQIGGVKGLFTALTGITTPNWFAYGLFPIVVVLGLHYTPFAFILIGGTLKNMDANLEEAALILKASRFRILRKITIPIVMPAMLSTLLLVFSSGISAFAVPAFLGSPVRFQVLTTQLFRTLNGVNPGYGYLIGLVMIALGTGILTINQILIGKRKSFTTVTGKASNVSLVSLKRLRGPISFTILIFLILISIFPLFIFAIQSFLVEPGNYSITNLSTIFWIGEGRPDIANGEPGILKNKYIYHALWNSFRLSILVSIIVGILGVLIGYAVVKKRGTPLANMLDRLSFFPYLIPAMAFSATYLSLFAVRRGIIPPLYGTFVLLVIIGSVKYLPFASRAGITSILQIGKEIEEAAVIFGVPWYKRMSRIIIPIQKPGFLSGFLLPFISSMRELSLYILLVTPSTQVLTTMLFQYNEKGWDQYANAIVLLIVLVVLFSNIVVNRVTGASIDRGIGG